MVDRPHVPTIWPIQESTYFIQDEVTTLKEVNFVLVSNSIIFFRNLFNDDFYPYAPTIGCRLFAKILQQ